MSAIYQSHYHAAPAAHHHTTLHQIPHQQYPQYPTPHYPQQQQQQPTLPTYMYQSQAQQATTFVPQPHVVPRASKRQSIASNSSSAASSYTHSPYSQPVSPTSHNIYPQYPDYQEAPSQLPPANATPKRMMTCPSSSGSTAGSARNSLCSDSVSNHSGYASEQDDLSSQQGGGDYRGAVTVTLENVQMSVGKIAGISASPHGSSFLQAALAQYPVEAFEVVYQEVAPVMGRLLQDKHACYVVKMVLEMMDKEEALAHLDTVARNEDLLLTLCTKDLHSRRMVQFILDFAGASRSRYLFDLAMARPLDIVRTQQGCITLQRILDNVTSQERESYFATVRSSFMEYALDPFGNYIIQYMLTEGDQVANSDMLSQYCSGQLHNMMCHKYASNVIEKSFGLVTPELQHDIIEEIFTGSEQTLIRVLNDRSANYVVQAAIRAASFRDVQLVNTRISPLLSRVQFGKKLQQRLARRLKQ